MRDISEKVESAIKLLRKEGLRITEQRKAILNVLAHADTPLSAEENHVNLTTEQCDLVTVYRCLEQFVKKGIVEMGVRENGTKVYWLGHGDGTGHHHHLTCRKCGRAERVDLCVGSELEKIAHGYGYTKITHVMEAFGLCPICR